jgi:hypothetical protein
MSLQSSILNTLKISIFTLGFGALVGSSASAQVDYTSTDIDSTSSDESGTNATTYSDVEDFLHIPPTRLYGGVWLGFAGRSEYAGDSYRPYGASTVGGQFGVDVVGFHEIFSLGAEIRFGAAKSSAGERSNLLDVVVKPRLRLVPDNCPLEFYFTVPVGFTMPRVRDTSSDANANIGWNLGVGGGMNLFFSEHFGINVEPMWLTHRFKVDGGDGGKLKISEFALFLNAVLAI